MSAAGCSPALLDREVVRQPSNRPPTRLPTHPPYLPFPTTCSREHICWPPTNYSLESRCRFFQNHCAELPPPQRRLARAQQCRVDLMQRWLEGKVTAQQAAEEESLIQQALAQPAA